MRNKPPTKPLNLFTGKDYVGRWREAPKMGDRPQIAREGRLKQRLSPGF